MRDSSADHNTFTNALRPAIYVEVFLFCVVWINMSLREVQMAGLLLVTHTHCSSVERMKI